jgi:ABC-type multidrug transport system fused ATPase/permease subunit
MLKNIRDSLALADLRERPLLAALFVVNLLSAVLEATGVGFVYAFLKAVMAPETLGGIAELQTIHDWLAIKERHTFFAVMTLFVMGVFLVRILMQFLGSWMMLWMRKKLQLRVAGVLFGGYIRAPYSRHLSSKSSALMNNVTANAGAAVAQCTLGVVEIAGAVALAGVFVVTLLAVKPLETLVTVSIIGILAVTYWSLMHERLIVWGRSMMHANEQVYSAVGETALAIKTIKVNGVESAFEQRFLALVAEQMGLVVKNGLAQNLPRFVLELVIVVGVFGAMFSVFVVGETVQSIIPTMALFGLAALRMAPAFVRIITALQLYRNSMPSLEAILPDYRQYSAHAVAQSFAAASGLPPELAHTITLEDLRFSYAGSAAPALNGVSITIAKGQLVGFAGPSGSGKSTTVDILLGLLEPTQGQVLIDGHPRMAGQRGTGSGLFAYVPQEPVILDDTIRSNVAFGVPHHEIDDERIWAAIKGAALYIKIKSMADGLNSTLGERGNTLSGGERQRLGIARALYLDAPVIILDEPTAALDANTEFEVTEAIRGLRGCKTIIVIAHRLSSIAHCDRIFFFDHGRVTGQGTFEQVVHDVPAFQRMVEHLRCGEAEPSAGEA